MKLRTGSMEEVVRLALRIPDFSDPHNLESDPDSAPTQMDHILIAEVDGAPVGFRAGHRLSPDTFAVWLAGVLPEHRQQGIARALYRRQKEWLESEGYRYLRTHVRNSNRIMLEVMVRNGYDIIDVMPDADDIARNRIVFLKRLLVSTR